MKRVVIVDYGSQYTPLLLSRLREQGHDGKIVQPDAPASKFKNAVGLILSGSPYSVYEEGAPQLSRVLARLIFKKDMPTLAICFGMQLLCQYAAKGSWDAVEPRKVTEEEDDEVGEYGKTTLEISHPIGVLETLAKHETVWMSHGDFVVRLPPNSHRLDPIKDKEHPEDYPPMTINIIGKPIFCLQFHPEVSHTPSGKKIIENFLRICGAEKNWDAGLQLEQMEINTLIQIAERHVFAFVSGGNDSSVLARFLKKIVPEDRLHFYYVRGLGPDEDLEKIKIIGGVHIVDARRKIYRVLKGVIDPEEKRQIIGKLFADIFKREAEELAETLGCNVGDLLLAQGTIHPDIIESGPGHTAKIKSHHNTVLQELLGAENILEPFANLFKPNVREVGRILNVDGRLIGQHPSPGPGYAVRFICYDGGREPPLPIELVHSEPRERKFLEAMSCERELQKLCEESGYKGWVLPLKSKGVQGDQSSYCYTAGIIGPHERKPLLELARTIPNRFKGKINRVVYMVAPDYATSLWLVSLKRDYFRAKTRDITDRANKIFIESLRIANLYPLISQAFVAISTLSFNRLGYSAIIRAVDTEDYMTASPHWLPWSFLEKAASDIMRKVPEIQIVFYDLTSKPPGTIEWE